MKKVVLILVAAMAASAMAESTLGGWSLTIGPAWRSRVKSSIHGTAPVPAVQYSHTGPTYDKDVAGHGAWSVDDVDGIVQDPHYPNDTSKQKYEVVRTGTETTVTPYSSNAALSDDDIDRPLGLKFSLGKDFYENERFAIGLNLKFAGYWNMRSSATGYAGGGVMSVRTTKDHYLFNDGPIPNDTDFEDFYPSTTPYKTDDETVETPIAGSYVGARIRSDLYQIGIGPKFTYHIFDWLDAYGNVEALCNIAHMECDCGTSSGSDTECLLGFGGHLGLTGFFTDNIGLYAEVGYEWIDKAETDLGSAKIDVDYSSLVVSAGAVFRF